MDKVSKIHFFKMTLLITARERVLTYVFMKEVQMVAAPKNTT